MSASRTVIFKPGIMSLRDLLAAIEGRLLLVHTMREARTVAWLLLTKLTGQCRATLIAAAQVDLDASQVMQLEGWLSAICDRHMPVQYLIGSVPFAEALIRVRPPTLIPRPETEEWVVRLTDQLRSLAGTPLTILDLCTGSGCIAIALAKILPPGSRVVAVDLSSEALALAHENAKANAVDIVCIKSDLFACLKGESFDLIVSNPPYVTDQEWQDLAQRITAWEDRGALVAPRCGLAILERIIAEAQCFLRENKELQRHGISRLTLEIGEEQAQEVVCLMEQHGYHSIVVTKDLAGRNRTISGI